MASKGEITNPFALLILGCLYSWATWETLDWLRSDLFIVPALLALCAVLAFIKGIFYSLLLILKLILRRRTMKPSDRSAVRPGVHRVILRK